MLARNVIFVVSLIGVEGAAHAQSTSPEVAVMTVFAGLCLNDAVARPVTENWMAEMQITPRLPQSNARLIEDGWTITEANTAMYLDTADESWPEVLPFSFSYAFGVQPNRTNGLTNKLCEVEFADVDGAAVGDLLFQIGGYELETSRQLDDGSIYMDFRNISGERSAFIFQYFKFESDESYGVISKYSIEQ